MKAKLSLLFVVLTTACMYQPQFEAYEGEELGSCPRVQIRLDDRTIIQKAGGKDLFKIEMVAYEGHCYYDERIEKDKAVVSPKFKITRLTDTNVEDVHFSYYLETAEGPTKFLGKKTYFGEVRMPKGSFESYYTPEPGELSFKAGSGKVEMYIGLYAIKADSEYKTK